MTMILDGHKLYWHRERVEAWMAGERVAPITIDCALTRRCNYRCSYCYGKLQENERRNISWRSIARFLDDAAEIGVKAVSFVSDGESTLHPDLNRAILHGRRNGLDMALGTNGLLFDPDPDVLASLTYLRFNFSAADPRRYAEIHGVKADCFETVCRRIEQAVKVKRQSGLPITIGLQMVFMPAFADQVIPLARLGKQLGVDYTIFKHCSDDELHSLSVKYEDYAKHVPLLVEAESLSENGYEVRTKWSKILSGSYRRYPRCYGPAFIMQFSGSGLVAPCGMLFNERFRDLFHIGNIAEGSFKNLWKSDRYWKVLNLIGSDEFDPQTMCGSLCLQHKVNEFLWDLKQGAARLPQDPGPKPEHVNFI